MHHMSTSNKMVQYYDNYSILIINQQKKLRRIYVPFRVICIHPIEQIQINAWLYVDEVIEDEDDLLLYKIGGNLYPYAHFTIIVNF